MSKIGIGFLCCTVVVVSLLVAEHRAVATPAFSKEFVKVYVDPVKDATDSDKKAFYLAAKAKTGKCWICHVNMTSEGEKGLGKKIRNNYGRALSEFLDKENYSSKRRKAEPEKVSAEIRDAFKKVGAMKSDPNNPDSPTFDELIASGKLPGDNLPNPEDLKKAIADRDSKK